MTVAARAAVRGRSPAVWGMTAFIATEATLFGMLLFGYFFLRARHDVWPPAGVTDPELPLVLVNTAILLSSSLPMHVADRALRTGRMRTVRLGLGLAFVLGAVFLGVQAYEYTQQPFGPRSHAYGSVFFIVTGFHGAHVAVGLAMNLFVQAGVWLGRYSAVRHDHVRNAAVYWHFVDAVWIAVFVSLYLSPRFL